MALCLIPSRAVCRYHSSVSLKYWLNSLCTHCHPSIQVIHGVFTCTTYMSSGMRSRVTMGGGGCSQMMAVNNNRGKKKDTIQDDTNCKMFPCR